MATMDPVEMLFVCASTKEGWPINIYDVLTGSCLWSYKGSEFQGELSTQSIIVAHEYIFTAISGRPVISHLSLQAKNRTHFRSFIPGPVQCLAVTNDSSICSAGIGDKIYTWLVSNGALTSVVGGHYQAVNKLQFTTDGSFLISGGKDGRILAWNLVDLLAPEISTIKKPTSATRCWAAHSLPVTDLKVGFGGTNCRIFSVSLDQSAKIHSLASGQLLVTLIFDCALSACAVDDPETRLFIGTVKGDIIQVNLFVQPVARERHIQTAVEDVGNPIFSGHNQKITELCVNMDSTLLASGSEDGSVRIWHINSRQCMRNIQCNGTPNSLVFTSSLPSILDRDYMCSHPVQPFQKQLRSNETQGRVVVKLKGSGSLRNSAIPNENELQYMLDNLRNEEMLSREITSSAPIISNKNQIQKDKLAVDQLEESEIRECPIEDAAPPAQKNRPSRRRKKHIDISSI